MDVRSFDPPFFHLDGYQKLHERKSMDLADKKHELSETYRYRFAQYWPVNTKHRNRLGGMRTL